MNPNICINNNCIPHLKCSIKQKRIIFNNVNMEDMWPNYSGNKLRWHLQHFTSLCLEHNNKDAHRHLKHA